MSASRRYQLGSFVTSVRDGASHARLPTGGIRLGSKTDASSRRSDPLRIAANCAEIREIRSANRPRRLGQSCRLDLNLEQYCRIVDWTPESTLAAGPAVYSSRSGESGPVSLPRGAGIASGRAAFTTPYKFVRQLFVYDMIVRITSFGRSPLLVGFAPGGRLATCYNRDYDPCPALGGSTRPGRGREARPSDSRRFARASAKQEGYPV